MWKDILAVMAMASRSFHASNMNAITSASSGDVALRLIWYDPTVSRSAVYCAQNRCAVVHGVLSFETWIELDITFSTDMTFLEAYEFAHEAETRLKQMIYGGEKNNG